MNSAWLLVYCQAVAWVVGIASALFLALALYGLGQRAHLVRAGLLEIAFGRLAALGAIVLTCAGFVVATWGQ